MRRWPIEWAGSAPEMTPRNPSSQTLRRRHASSVFIKHMHVAQPGAKRNDVADFRRFPPADLHHQTLRVGAGDMGERGFAQTLDQFDGSGSQKIAAVANGEMLGTDADGEFHARRKPRSG